MDFASLKEQVSNLTLYDIKAGVRKVQNGMSVLSPESPLSAMIYLSSFVLRMSADCSAFF